MFVRLTLLLLLLVFFQIQAKSTIRKNDVSNYNKNVQFRKHNTISLTPEEYNQHLRRYSTLNPRSRFRYLRWKAQNIKRKRYAKRCRSYKPKYKKYSPRSTDNIYSQNNIPHYQKQHDVPSVTIQYSGIRRQPVNFRNIPPTFSGIPWGKSKWNVAQPGKIVREFILQEPLPELGGSPPSIPSKFNYVQNNNHKHYYSKNNYESLENYDTDLFTTKNIGANYKQNYDSNKDTVIKYYNSQQARNTTEANLLTKQIKNTSTENNIYKNLVTVLPDQPTYEDAYEVYEDVSEILYPRKEQSDEKTDDNTKEIDVSKMYLVNNE